MVNRVSIQASGLRVSKPGYDVLTANGNQLVMGLSNATLGSVQSGIVSVAAKSPVTVFYSSSYSYVPFSLWTWYDPVNLSVTYGGGYYSRISSGSVLYDDGYGIDCDCYTNGIIYRNYKNSTVHIRYYVYQYDHIYL